MRDIVIGKLVDRTIDDDYEELSERLFGEGNCFNSSEVRKRMYGMRAIIEAIERDSESAINDEDALSALDEKRIELQKERQKYSDQRSALNKLIRERSRQEELNDILLSAVRAGELPTLDYRSHEPIYSDNDLLVSLNDMHYGADVSNYWNTYNSDICRDMMRNYIDRIITIAKIHSSENCVVWANGDQISGNIHQSIAVTNKENVIQQITGVSELIAEFLAELSKHFTCVKYVSVAGNHSRIDTKDRALKDERLDDLVEWYLGARLQGIPNIIVGACDKIDETMYLLDVRGKTYAGVHGDYEGNASKVQALVTMAQRPVYAVLSGHKHHNMIDTIQGVKTIMAGSFIGMDDHCVKLRIYGEPEQLVCVCDSDGVRCSYDINLKK
jgi:predicted phosphodiesterase